MLKRGENEEPGIRVGSARNLARKLLKDAKVKEPPVYINQLVSTLEKDHELVIKPWLLSNHVSGFLVEEDRLSAIAYNADHHVHRQRFTVAHEIGHLLLGHNHSTKTEATEKEAQIFASELLMPLEFLKSDLKKHGCNIDSLRERYWVSKDAMSWRIQDSSVLKYV